MGAIAFPRNVNKTVYTLPSAGGGVGGGGCTLFYSHFIYAHFSKRGELSRISIFSGVAGKEWDYFFQKGRVAVFT